MTKKLQVHVGQSSNPGRKPVNQDFHGTLIPKEPLLSTKGIVVAIADGISSSQVSQVASEIAIKTFLEDYYCTSEAWSVKKSAQTVLRAINSWLYTQTQNSPYRYNKDKGYICTFSAIILKSNTAHLLHTGDSRIYRLANHNLEQLTLDHRRVVSSEISYLTRGLGIHNSLELDYQSITLQEGEYLVLATDGVYEYLTSELIASTLNYHGEDLDNSAKALVEYAYDAGSKDNLSIQIIRVDSLPEKQLDEIQREFNDIPPPPPLQPRMQFDGYHILREIHISSRSHIFLAEDMASGKQVAIKTPSTELRNNSEFLEQLLMEGWIAKRINNAHVLKAPPASRAQQYLYLVTEYIEGKTLHQWMLDNPNPDIDEVRNIISQIATGLQAFHRQEMVHQDLRPQNIMITHQGVVKIIDFGAIKVAGINEILPHNQGLKGTAQFTAPEYFLGEEGKARSDIFSLGVITYKMLSGKLPYGNTIAKATSKRAQTKLSYHPLHVENQQIPGWVDYAISKATHISPLKRYQVVSEFIYDLKNPNKTYLSKHTPPLLERDPVLFWQLVSLSFFLIIIFLLLRSN